MLTVKGSEINRETDMYGYEIDKSADYVVDHIDGFGNAEYVKHVERNPRSTEDVDVKDTAFAMFFV